MKEQSCKHGIIGGCDLCIRDRQIYDLQQKLDAAISAIDEFLHADTNEKDARAFKKLKRIVKRNRKEGFE
jgi:hypothetical protein